jgi:ketosteroid isomerase-like protein
MAPDNVALLRPIYAEWAKGNFATGTEIYSPDVMFVPAPERTEIQGRAGVAAYMRDFLAQWSEFRIVAQDFRASGEVVVVTEQQTAVGITSGIELDGVFYAVWRFEDGLATDCRWTRDALVADAALSQV